MKNPDSRQASSGFEQLHFLPDPGFIPFWPNPDKLPGRLKILFSVPSLTRHEFMIRAGSWQLTAVVYQLRMIGWPIESLEIHAPNTATPGRAICGYDLPAKLIAQA